MLNLTLERIERQLRYLPVEHVYVLGPDNEILFHHTDDQANQVTFPWVLLTHLDIKVVTHNHPGGRSFSRRDVLLAREAKLPELRVVTVRQRFSLHPPIAGWESLAVDEFTSIVNREEALQMQRVRAEIQRRTLTADLADRVLHHRMCECLDELGLIRYSVQTW